MLVTERECASGQEPGDRMGAPDVAVLADEVVVTFYVVSLLATESTATCLGNPAVPYLVVLGEPLGERDLVDGGVSPPQSRLN